MLILLDTNILISAFVLNSKSILNLLDLCLQKQHTLCIDDYCMNELNNILTNKFFDIEMNVDVINRIMSLPTIKFIFTNKKYQDTYATRDYKDDRVLNSAIANKVDFLLTGDEDLLSFCTTKIRIVNPTNLMSLI